MPDLVHWTCADHGAPGIRADGLVRPAVFPWPLVWLTTERERSARRALGLSSLTLSCDRMAVLFVVTGDAEPWLDTSESQSPWGQVLSTAPGANPTLWWVSRVPLRATEVRHA